MRFSVMEGLIPVMGKFCGNIYIFLSYLNTEMAQGVEAIPRGRQSYIMPPRLCCGLFCYGCIIIHSFITETSEWAR